MPKGTKLSEFEKGQITVYNQQGKSNREIGILLGRSHDLVNKFVKNPEGYGTRKSSGRPCKLSERDKRRIYRTASNSTKNSIQIKRELDLDVSSWTIRRAISKNSNLVRRKMKRAPALTQDHKRRRVEFARQHINRDWSNVSFLCPLWEGSIF